MSNVTTTGRGDADAALMLARTLRSEGFHATAIKVGDVTIEMAIIAGPSVGTFAPSPRAAADEARGVIDEWGGPEFAKALSETQPDLVDDDEQPAVRS